MSTTLFEPPASRKQTRREPILCRVCNRKLGTEISTRQRGRVVWTAFDEFDDDNHWRYCLMLGEEPRCLVPCSGPDGADPELLAFLAKMAMEYRADLRAECDESIKLRREYQEALAALKAAS